MTKLTLKSLQSATLHWRLLSPTLLFLHRTYTPSISSRPRARANSTSTDVFSVIKQQNAIPSSSSKLDAVEEQYSDMIDSLHKRSPQVIRRFRHLLLSSGINRYVDTNKIWATYRDIEARKQLSHLTTDEFEALINLVGIRVFGSQNKSKGRALQTLEILKHLQNLGHQPSKSVLIKVINACARAGMAEQVKSLCDQLARISGPEILQTPKLVSFIATAHVIANDLPSAERTISTANINPKYLHPVAHWALIQAYIQTNNPDMIKHHFSLLKHHAQRLAHSPKPTDAKDLCIASCNSIIQYYAKTRPIDTQTLKDYMHQMSSELKMLNAESWTVAMQAFLSANDIQAAQSCWDHLQNKAKTLPMLKNAIKFASMTQNPESALSCIHQYITINNRDRSSKYQKPHVPRPICHDVAVAIGPITSITPIVNHLKSSQLRLTPEISSVLLRGYHSLNDLNSSTLIFSTMQKQGLMGITSPESKANTIDAYSKLLTLYAHKFDMNTITTLLSDLRTQLRSVGVKLGVLANLYISLINAFVLNVDEAGVRWVVEEIRRDGVVLEWHVLGRMKRTLGEKSEVARWVVGELTKDFEEEMRRRKVQGDQ